MTAHPCGCVTYWHSGNDRGLLTKDAPYYRTVCNVHRGYVHRCGLLTAHRVSAQDNATPQWPTRPWTQEIEL